MVSKYLKKNDLQVSYELLPVKGLPLDAPDENLYNLGFSIGGCLKAFPKSIDQNIIYTLVEA